MSEERKSIESEIRKLEHEIIELEKKLAGSDDSVKWEFDQKVTQLQELNQEYVQILKIENGDDVKSYIESQRSRETITEGERRELELEEK